MRGRGRVRRPNHSNRLAEVQARWPAVVLAVVFALGMAIPALAAYLGPDRDYSVTITESETVPDPDNDRWTLTRNNTVLGEGPGTCIIIHTCSQHPGAEHYQSEGLCDWNGPADNSSCTPAFKTIQTTRTETRYYPEATISGGVQCAQDGANGWCIGSGTLELGASEPLGGYTILGIEGSLGGDAFFCAGANCSVAGNPGAASASYWALSDYGDSSRQGDATLKIDNDLPTIAGLVNGLQGKPGWYVGDITLTAVGADATSGLAAQQVQVDGGGWHDASATISTDGLHSVVFRAEDVAGQTAYTAPQSLGRDTAPPSLSLDGYDAPARGRALVMGTASDATSGVAAVHFSLDGSLKQTVATSGGAWQLSWDSTEVPNGTYTLQVYAEDQAGHYSTPQQVQVVVDNLAPYINLSSACRPIWQALNLDAGPGAAPIRLVSLTVSNGSQSLTEIFPSPPQNWVWNRTFSDGSLAPIGDYTLEVYVEDESGNASSRTACIRIPLPEAAAASSQATPPPAPPLQSFVPPSAPQPLPSPSFANAQPSVTVITELQPQPVLVQQLQQASPANAAVWGPAALTLAAAATAIAMSQKAKREEEERRRNEPDPFQLYPDNLMAAQLSDDEVLAQVKAAGARANISVEEARIITHNALLASGIYTATGAQLNEKARQEAKDSKLGGGAYTVQPGDNWHSIAEKVYGNQRMAGQLIDANVPKGSDYLTLHPGQTIALPVVTGTEAARPNYDPEIWDKVVKFTLAQEATRTGKVSHLRPPQAPELPEGPAGLELALRMLASGALTPAAFHTMFPQVDLANAIYAANTGQLSATTVEWLWRENVYSQAALQQKQEDTAALRKGLIDLQARDISEAELLAMFPHLPIDQALALADNPEGLYTLWMTHAGKAWVQGIEDRKAEEARQASYQTWRQGELADPSWNKPSRPWHSFLPLLLELSKFVIEVKDALFQVAVRFKDLGNGYFSASTPWIRAGFKRFVRQAAGITGTRYAFANQLRVTRTALTSGIKKSLLIGTALSTISNIYDYGIGENKEIGIRSSEFLASTGWDIAETAAITLAAAAIGVVATALFGVTLGVAGIIVLAAGMIISFAMGPTLSTWKERFMDRVSGDD